MTKNHYSKEKFDLRLREMEERVGTGEEHLNYDATVGISDSKPFRVEIKTSGISIGEHDLDFDEAEELFAILYWWNDNKYMLEILDAMAKDVMG